MDSRTEFRRINKKTKFTKSYKRVEFVDSHDLQIPDGKRHKEQFPSRAEQYNHKFGDKKKKSFFNHKNR